MRTRIISEEIIYAVKMILTTELKKSDQEIGNFVGISKTAVYNIRKFGDTVRPKTVTPSTNVFSLNSLITVEKPRGRGRRVVPEAVKQAVVQDYVGSTLTIKQIVEKHNVGYTSVYRWVEQYEPVAA